MLRETEGAVFGTYWRGVDGAGGNGLGKRRPARGGRDGIRKRGALICNQMTTRKCYKVARLGFAGVVSNAHHRLS